MLIYAFLLAEGTGVDPVEAIRHKLELNERKYPVELAKGSAVKYTEL